MKHFRIYAIALTLALSVFTSCKKDEDTSPVLAGYLQQGTWRVTEFKDDDVNKTANFAGYTFTFKSGGVVSVLKPDGSTVNGEWTVENDNQKEKLDLEFGVAEELHELNDDWHETAFTATKIQLEDPSVGGITIDRLTFEKN